MCKPANRVMEGETTPSREQEMGSISALMDAAVKQLSTKGRTIPKCCGQPVVKK